MRTCIGPYLDTGPSSHPSGLVRPHWAILAQVWVSIRTPICHDRPRQGLKGHSTVWWYPCTTELRTLQGPLVRWLHGPSGAPPRPDRRLAAGQGHNRTCLIGASRFGAPIIMYQGRDLCGWGATQYGMSQRTNVLQTEMKITTHQVPSGHIGFGTRIWHNSPMSPDR